MLCIHLCILNFSLFTTLLNCRRGREGSYLPSPRTNPGVRNYRTGLFRDTRFRMITYSATNCLFPAVRLAQISSPACLDCVSFASCVSLSAPSPCERRYRLGVLRADPTPDCLRLSYLIFRFAYLLSVWWTITNAHGNRNISGLPSSCAFLSTHATLLNEPRQTLRKLTMSFSLCRLPDR
jgi:hypothetical protein